MNGLSRKEAQDVLSMAEILEIPGLDMMQGILEGIYPAAPIAKILNYKVHAVKKGKVVFRGAPNLDSRNPMGTIHGGWYGTILDSAMACAVMTTLPAGKIQTTLEFKVNIIRSIPAGAQVDAIGTVEHSGKSTGVAVGSLVDVNTGKLYASSSTTCIIMTPKLK
jgi:uncharacterized protein (TIGR00369 family)|tara:strand:+ start:594 stop:1085 length:492 start_codon:yes stop_codon:yes gene_type:complete